MNLKNISIISLRVLAPTHQPLIGFVILFFAYLTNISATKLHAQTTITTGTSATITTFTFTLEEPCKTSAGVYMTNGTLVRTLWSKVRYYAAGTYTTNWNGLDDSGNPVAAGTYQIKLLEHNTEYVWDGAIGNTSSALSGPTVHRGFYTMQDLAISRTNAFYDSGYNESQFGFRSFLTTDAQHVKNSWFWDANQGSAPGLSNRSWYYVTADNNWVYFGCPATFNATNSALNGSPGCIVASKVVDDSLASFSLGTMITNGPGDYFPSGIYAGSQPGLSGLAVQVNGNILAAAVAPDNKIYLFDKNAGNLLGSISVNAPGRMSFALNGNLWVTTTNSVVCLTNLNGTPAGVTTITAGLSQPLAVAANSTNADLILVADGGSSQQVKAFNTKGVLLWTYGLAGGYQTNGPAVTTNKFWFYADGQYFSSTFITFAPDGSFWVGDGGNHRSLHFDASRNYLEQITYQPHGYVDSVDQNNPSRVFNQFLEFIVDYTKPLSNSWTLVNNWEASTDANHDNPAYFQGIYNVTTLSNGRTYCLCQNAAVGKDTFEICELVPGSGLRPTGVYPNGTGNNNWIDLNARGDIQVIIPNNPEWFEYPLTGFDTNNNPTYGPPIVNGSAPDGSANPAPRCCSGGGPGQTTITTNNIIISLDSTLNNGYHLGGVPVGGTNWLWQASPSGTLNQDGHYEITGGLTYPASGLVSWGNQIVYGYHGEFFRNQGQAAQYFHYLDDGLFVGQFGEASPGHSTYEGALPGFAGNNICINMDCTNGNYYVYGNDESSHGLQRWHLVNARNIREQSGVGALGGTITLTQPVVNFPTGVTSQAGGNSVELEWLPVPNAASYNIYYSLINGGPYQTPAGRTAATNCFIGGLSNGLTYYFAVTAVVGGDEGMPSEQVSATPFDTSQSVLCSGSMTEGGQDAPVIDINTNAVATGLPAWLGAEHLTGVLNPRELDDYGYGNLQEELIGTEGFVLYDWGGIGANFIDLSKNISVGSGSGLLPVLSTIVSIVSGSGWGDMNYLERQYSVNSVLGTNYGMAAAPLGSINISTTDNNFHYLTVVSPAKFNDARNFSMTLTSTNGSSASYSANENPGLSHVFQFLFKGNVTLTGNATGGAGAFVQALFLDRAPSISLTNPLSPPSDLRVTP